MPGLLVVFSPVPYLGWSAVLAGVVVFVGAAAQGVRITLESIIGRFNGF